MTRFLPSRKPIGWVFESSLRVNNKRLQLVRLVEARTGPLAEHSTTTQIVPPRLSQKSLRGSPFLFGVCAQQPPVSHFDIFTPTNQSSRFQVDVVVFQKTNAHNVVSQEKPTIVTTTRGRPRVSKFKPSWGTVTFPVAQFYTSNSRIPSSSSPTSIFSQVARKSPYDTKTAI